MTKMYNFVIVRYPVLLHNPDFLSNFWYLNFFFSFFFQIAMKFYSLYRLYSKCVRTFFFGKYQIIFVISHFIWKYVIRQNPRLITMYDLPPSSHTWKRIYGTEVYPHYFPFSFTIVLYKSYCCGHLNLIFWNFPVKFSECVLQKYYSAKS